MFLIKPYKEQFIGYVSGLLGGHVIRPAILIRLAEKRASKAEPTLSLNWGGAQSC